MRQSNSNPVCDSCGRKFTPTQIIYNPKPLCPTAKEQGEGLLLDGNRLMSPGSWICWDYSFHPKRV
jgi:hypothetical protein